MNLISKTIKAHIKHFNLKLKNDFLYKGDLVIFTLPLTNSQEETEQALFYFLEGLSSGLDNKELW